MNDYQPQCIWNDGPGPNGAGVPGGSQSWEGSTQFSQIIDGLSNTIFWTEKLAYCSILENAHVGGSRWAATGGIGAGANDYYEAVVGAFYQSPYITVQLNVPNSCCIRGNPSSQHTAVMLVGLGDGSVRSIGSGMSQATFNLAMLGNDGFPMPSDW